MALVLEDRVRETTSSTGTGPVTLTGAFSGFQPFSVIGDGNTTYYAIIDPTAGSWEVGIGTYTSSGNTLSRDTVLSSSNAGSLVSFAAGLKDVICTQPSERAVYLDSASNATIPGITLSGGTANGVAFLNGSKVLTTGSALTFDGTNFATTGNANLGSAAKSTNTELNFFADTGTQRIFIDRGSRSLVFSDVSSGIENYRIAGITGTQTWGVGGSEQMRLTSTGLGIGTSSPGAKLDVVGTVQSNGAFSVNGTAVGSASKVWFGSDGNAGGFINVPSSQPLNIYQNNATLVAQFSASGNLGLGVTPSSASGAVRSFEFGQRGVLWATTSTSNTALATNAVLDGSANWVYKQTGAANAYQQDGQHRWLTAPSGTAGNAISFTQAMTLDASGNFALGSTNTSTGGRAYIVNDSATLLPVVLQNTSTTSGAGCGIDIRVSNGATGGFLYVESAVGSSAYNMNLRTGQSGGGIIFRTGSGGPERARIDSSGNLLVGTTSLVSVSGVDGRFTASQADVRWIGVFQNTNATPLGVAVRYATDSNNASSEFLYCVGNATVRASIRSNGGIANYSANDVNLSDRREKTNFAPAKSYLETICAIPVQTFNYIDQNNEADPGLTLGVVAQDVQAVAPELVMESNWAPQGEEPKMRLSIYQTDLQYALMKALQELKAEFDAYKATHP